MKERKVYVKASQVDRLIEGLRNLPSKPVGDHLRELPDDQVVDYMMETLASEDVDRIDIHLASCPECNEEMLWLLEESQAWRGTRGEQRLTAFRERVRKAISAKDRSAPHAAVAAVGPATEKPERVVGAWVREVFDQMLADLRRALGGGDIVWECAPDEEGSRLMWRWPSPDGRLQAHAVREENGDWTFRIAAEALELEGKYVELRLGPMRRTEKLEQVSATEVGAEIVIARQDLDLPKPPFDISLLLL